MPLEGRAAEPPPLLLDSGECSAAVSPTRRLPATPRVVYDVPQPFPPPLAGLLTLRHATRTPPPLATSPTPMARPLPPPISLCPLENSSVKPFSRSSLPNFGYK